MPRVTGLSRMLSILDLFGEARPVLTVEDIIARCHYSRPTGYRYVRELVSAGLLVRADGGYALGPRIIELDWLIRRSDPVLTRSREVVRTLAQRTACTVSQMGLYGDRIVTVHLEQGPEPLAVGFDRGRPMPLFRGAPSRAIIAFMQRARLARLFDRHGDELVPAQRDRGFEPFHEDLQSIRKAGYAISVGELDPGKVGIAAPVFRHDRTVAGSLCLVMTEARYETAKAEALVTRLLDATSAIAAVLKSGPGPEPD